MILTVSSEAYEQSKISLKESHSKIKCMHLMWIEGLQFRNSDRSPDYSGNVFRILNESMKLIQTEGLCDYLEIQVVS